jgi:hypothetical protein
VVSKKQVFADMRPTVNAVVLNSRFKNAHHDMLLPVRKRGDKVLRYVAMQARYSHRKDVSTLGNRWACRPSNCTTEVQALIQCCSTFEGKQSFKDVTWKTFQAANKYTVIDGKSVSLMGLLLQVL